MQEYENDEYYDNNLDDILEKQSGTNSYSVDFKQYESRYSYEGFWTKIKKHYKSAGAKIIEIAITLFYTLRDVDTPKWAKSIILGALGYFILPIDIIPDFVPVAGFSDDFVTIAVAFAAVALSIKPEHIKEAKNFTNKIF